MKGFPQLESVGGGKPTDHKMVIFSPRIGPPATPILQVISLVQVHLKDLSAQQRQWWITIFFWVYRMQVPIWAPGINVCPKNHKKSLTQPSKNNSGLGTIVICPEKK